MKQTGTPYLIYMDEAKDIAASARSSFVLLEKGALVGFGYNRDG